MHLQKKYNSSIHINETETQLSEAPQVKKEKEPAEQLIPESLLLQLLSANFILTASVFSLDTVSSFLVIFTSMIIWYQYKAAKNYEGQVLIISGYLLSLLVRIYFIFHYVKNFIPHVTLNLLCCAIFIEKTVQIISLCSARRISYIWLVPAILACPLFVFYQVFYSNIDQEYVMYHGELFCLPLSLHIVSSIFMLEYKNMNRYVWAWLVLYFITSIIYLNLHADNMLVFSNKKRN